MKIKLVALATPLLAIVFSVTSVAAQGQYASGSTGIDASYPNCKSTIPKASFGIAGVTGGLAFSQNTCLSAEASHFGNLSLYTNTGYAGQSYGLKYQFGPRACSPIDWSCLAYNYGYNAGQDAVAYANSQGLHSTTWWLDVEILNSWTNDPQQNRNSLQGEYDALSATGITTVGVYSTTFQWDLITGGWLNFWPSWGATTWNTAKQAATYCTGHQFTGGVSYLMQFRGRTLDQDYAC
ncbi:MAG TPA: hypothetical protein VLG13_01035 [Patescibacteria group bacterium]|nr:hypothetical protein [Patescibacteria group bacterium]